MLQLLDEGCVKQSAQTDDKFTVIDRRNDMAARHKVFKPTVGNVPYETSANDKVPYETFLCFRSQFKSTCQDLISSNDLNHQENIPIIMFHQELIMK